MRAVFQQMLSLLLYFLVLGIVSRLLDLVLWHIHGMSPTQVLDPRLVLGVRQLKSLLDARGVGYAGCVEKHELAELVENSGPVVRSQLATLDSTDTGSKARLAAPASHFSGGAHFYEEVEDTKDSVWLVQVAPEGSEPPLDDYSWRLVCAHLAPFAIRTGVFDCKLDRRLCAGKGWHEPLLLLALPRGTRAKDKVLMQIFRSTRPQAIVSWVRQQLSERVEKVTSLSAASVWLDPYEEPEFDPQHSLNTLGQPLELNTSNQVRVLLVAQLARPPLFLAALSVKFAGRVRFGLLRVGKGEEESVRKELGVSKLPAYLISTPQGNHKYGSGREQHLDFRSMLSFLRTVQPEANDALIFSLVICQVLSFIRIATKRTILGMVLTFLAHNLSFLAIWLIIISLGRVPLISVMLADYCACATRWLALSSPGLWCLADIQLLSRHPNVLIVTSALFLFVVRKFFLEPTESPASQTLSLRMFTRLFPTTSPMQAQEEHPGPDELLIQRLAVPGLWLTPLVCADYLRSLARWRHRGVPDIKKDRMSRALMAEVARRVESGKESEFSEDEGPPSNALRAAECPICLEMYSRGTLLCALPCGHTFHEACVMAWLLRDHHSCPSCRWPAYKRKKH